MADDIHILWLPHSRVGLRWSAEDVLQEVLKAIDTSLKNFRGETDAQFRGWCKGMPSAL
jgi:DNA-directed RNA polymerase specialized sigma24 family protein